MNNGRSPCNTARPTSTSIWRHLRTLPSLSPRRNKNGWERWRRIKAESGHLTAESSGDWKSEIRTEHSRGFAPLGRGEAPPPHQQMVRSPDDQIVMTRSSDDF